MLGWKVTARAGVGRGGCPRVKVRGARMDSNSGRCEGCESLAAVGRIKEREQVTRSRTSGKVKCDD